MKVTILKNSDLTPVCVVDWDQVPRVGERINVAEIDGNDELPVLEVVWFTDFTQVQGALSPVVVIVHDTIE